MAEREHDGGRSADEQNTNNNDRGGRGGEERSK